MQFLCRRVFKASCMRPQSDLHSAVPTALALCPPAHSCVFLKSNSSMYCPPLGHHDFRNAVASKVRRSRTQDVGCCRIVLLTRHWSARRCAVAFCFDLLLLRVCFLSFLSFLFLGFLLYQTSCHGLQIDCSHISLPAGFVLHELVLLLPSSLPAFSSCRGIARVPKP